MKTGMELVKEWRKDVDYLRSVGLPADAKRIEERADLLQAWLREADKELDLALAEASPFQLEPLSFIRDSLLGTTQSSGGSRGSREGKK